MKVLLLGAGGMLGRDLLLHAPTAIRVLAKTREELDVESPSALAACLRIVSPDVVVNATGFTKVDLAEAEPQRAYAVNCTAVRHLAEACVQARASLVHFSTDYVFSGDSNLPYAEDDPTQPLNVYGSSKLGGELAIEGAQCAALIVRTQWLFGYSGISFARTMWERARRRQVTRVVADQWGRPTFAQDLASATWTLIANGARGTFHVANTGQTTWYEFARHIFEFFGNPESLSPCSTADYPSAAKRPSFSVLDTTKFELAAGYSLPPWQDALHRFLKRLELESLQLE